MHQDRLSEHLFTLYYVTGSRVLYKLAVWIARLIISRGCFLKVLRMAMFCLMQLQEYIKTAWCMSISTLQFAHLQTQREF